MILSTNGGNMKNNNKIYLKAYRGLIEEIHKNLKDLKMVYSENLEASDSMLNELKIYNTNPFGIKGNINSIMNEDIILALLNTPNFAKLLFPIVTSKHYENPDISVRIAILGDIERRKIINQVFDEILQEQREALQNENIVKTYLAKVDK